MKPLYTSKDDFFESIQINIIDFGNATSYIDDKTKEHIEKGRLETFRGNMELGSLNQMKFHTTSRRDDLISLFYLLIFMLKGGQMPGFGFAAHVELQ